MSNSYPCPCCGHRVLGTMPGSYEICPVCFWEDDGVQFRWPTMGGGANKVSLIEAQRNYQDFRACDQHGRQYVRPPTADEPLDPAWRPIDLTRDSFEDWEAEDRAPWPDDRSVLCWCCPLSGAGTIMTTRVERLIQQLDDSTGPSYDARAELIGIGSDAIPAIIDELPSLGGFGELTAIEVFEEVADPRCGPALIALLGSDDGTVREWAAMALASLKIDSAVEPVRRAYRACLERATPPDWSEPVGIRWALIELGARSPVVPPLTARLRATAADNAPGWPSAHFAETINDLADHAQVILYSQFWRVDAGRTYGITGTGQDWEPDWTAPWEHLVEESRTWSLLDGCLIKPTEVQGHKAALGTTQGAPPPHRRRKAPPHFTITGQGESVGFRLADQQAREVQQRRWEAAMQEARTSYAHAYRVKHLEEQAGAWYQASLLAEYVAAVRDHATSLPPGQERTEIEAWLTFADAHLQHLTESGSAPKLPMPPKPSGDDLKPFLGHWSPYGPHSY